MSYNFVTIFNSLYLPQALALHESIKKFKINFKLWAICLDKLSLNVIENLNEKTFTAINFEIYEDKKLRKIKKMRSIAEYCWTITPLSPKLIFDIDKSVKFLTYVDADIFFVQNPKKLIDEFVKSHKYISFTRHDFQDNQESKEKIYGKFCVQFMTFKKSSSEKIRKIWEKKCLQWCYAKPSNGRMGDQKYLDEIYKKFHENIYIINDHAFRSTWNYKKINFKKIIGWHFHGFKIIKPNLFLMHHLEFMPKKINSFFYTVYALKIKKIINKIKFRDNQLIKNFFLINFFDRVKYKLIEYKILKRNKYYLG